MGFCLLLCFLLLCYETDCMTSIISTTSYHVQLIFSFESSELPSYVGHTVSKHWDSDQIVLTRPFTSSALTIPSTWCDLTGFFSLVWMFLLRPLENSENKRINTESSLKKVLFFFFHFPSFLSKKFTIFPSSEIEMRFPDGCNIMSRSACYLERVCTRTHTRMNQIILTCKNVRDSLGESHYMWGVK